jgi:very-short-patch-repair endonuclease
VQRPRFLAISEFGPRSIVYHEGSRYVINRVLLPVARVDDNKLPTIAVKRCTSCGYLHPIEGQDPGPDLCQRCGAPLDPPIPGLLRLQNVSTQRRERINSDEEERVRQGFEIWTGVRFARRDGLGERVAYVTKDGAEYAKLAYGSAATLWRVNVGWTRRKERNRLGFVLDTERGYWARNDQEAVEDTDDPLSPSRQRVVPYVEDRRNALLLQPLPRPWAIEEVASLAAALKVGMQAVFQLEEAELAAEPLPSRDFRHLLLFYEAAEGGAGVLRRLVAEPDALGEVARAALELCHFDPDTGDDRRRAPGAKEDCEAACYDCLLGYHNQSDHKLLDRKLIRDRLLDLASAAVEVSPVGLSREQHLELLLARCDTELEREFLRFLHAHGLELPTDAQYLIGSCRARPDFYYAGHQTAVFLDGPVHDHRDVAERDGRAVDRLEDAGYTVIRLRHGEEWAPIVERYPSIFGSLT